MVAVIAPQFREVTWNSAMLLADLGTESLAARSLHVVESADRSRPAGALCLVTAACGDSPPGVPAAGSTGSAPIDTSGFPVTLNNCGVSQTFARAPSRVMVMNGASVGEVSTLLALGLGDRIVANQQTYGMSEVPGREARPPTADRPIPVAEVLHCGGGRGGPAGLAAGEAASRRRRRSGLPSSYSFCGFSVDLLRPEGH